MTKQKVQIIFNKMNCVLEGAAEKRAIIKPIITNSNTAFTKL